MNPYQEKKLLLFTKPLTHRKKKPLDKINRNWIECLLFFCCVYTWCFSVPWWLALLLTSGINNHFQHVSHNKKEKNSLKMTFRLKTTLPARTIFPP